MKLGDLSKTEPWSGTGDQLPPGTYLAKVVEAKDDTSKAGNPMLVLDLQVIEGSYQGAEIKDWLAVTEATLGKVVAVLQALDYKIPEGEFDLKVSELTGRRCEIVVRDDTYVDRDGNERTTAKVRGYRKPVPVSDVPSDDFPFTGSNGAPAAADEKLPF